MNPKKIHECSDKMPVCPADLNVPCSPFIIFKAAELQKVVLDLGYTRVLLKFAVV